MLKLTSPADAIMLRVLFKIHHLLLLLIGEEEFILEASRRSLYISDIEHREFVFDLFSKFPVRGIVVNFLVVLVRLKFLVVAEQ